MKADPHFGYNLEEPIQNTCCTLVTLIAAKYTQATLNTGECYTTIELLKWLDGSLAYSAEAYIEELNKGMACAGFTMQLDHVSTPPKVGWCLQPIKP